MLQLFQPWMLRTTRLLLPGNQSVVLKMSLNSGQVVSTHVEEKQECLTTYSLMRIEEGSNSAFPRVVAATLMLQIMMPSNTRSFSDVATSLTLSLDADVSSMRIMFNAG